MYATRKIYMMQSRVFSVLIATTSRPMNNKWSAAARGFLPPGAKVRGAAAPTGNTHPQCTK